MRERVEYYPAAAKTRSCAKLWALESKALLMKVVTDFESYKLIANLLNREWYENGVRTFSYKMLLFLSFQ